MALGSSLLVDRHEPDAQHQGRHVRVLPVLENRSAVSNCTLSHGKMRSEDGGGQELNHLGLPSLSTQLLFGDGDHLEKTSPLALVPQAGPRVSPNSRGWTPMGCVRSRRGGVQGLRTPIHEACALPPIHLHPRWDTCPGGLGPSQCVATAPGHELADEPNNSIVIFTKEWARSSSQLVFSFQ